jgi:quercetin dioxygenase-like cupin family protein
MITSSISHLVLRKIDIESDWKLRIQLKGKNNGRKVLVNEIYPSKEFEAQDFEWIPGPETRKTPVVVTGIGGTEVATFTHEAGQDCHKHLIGTEAYTVLDGTMRVRLDESVIVELSAGDEIIVFPGTVHEVLPEDTQFLTRVHSINCYGDKDKYVKRAQDWCQIFTLKNLKHQA